MDSYNFPAYVNQTILLLLIMTWTDSCHSRAQQPRSSIKVVPFMYLKCMLRKGNAYFMLFLISFHKCCTYYRCSTYANIVVLFLPAPFMACEGLAVVFNKGEFVLYVPFLSKTFCTSWNCQSAFLFACRNISERHITFNINFQINDSLNEDICINNT